MTYVRVCGKLVDCDFDRFRENLEKYANHCSNLRKNMEFYGFFMKSGMFCGHLRGF